MTSNTSSIRKTVIENLIGVSTADFAQSHWGRTYLHASSGLREVEAALGGPWGLPEWRAATELGYEWPGSPRTLQSSPIPGQHHLDLLNIGPDQIDSALASGATIIGDVLDTRLSSFAAALKDELNVPGPVSTYGSLSPGGDAAVLHYDGSHVFVLQLEGRKRWRLSPRPVVTNPSRGRRISADGQVDSRHRLEDETIEQTNLDDLETVVLKPGDFLYVPPGTIHSTEALERSLSVMFNFAPPRFDALVELMVRRTLCDAAKWRGLPAAGPQGAHADYVNEGLQRLREILSGLDADSPEVRAAWDEMTANMGAMQNSFAASQRPLEAPQIEPDRGLKINRRYPVRYSERIDRDGEPRVTVYLGEEQITDVGAGAEFLRNVVEHAEFTGDEARHWTGDEYDWDVVRGYLDSLVQQGLLTAA
jgi:hypothetical protein